MHRNTSLISIALMAGLTVPAWGAASTSPLVGAGLSHGDVAILGLLLALSASAVALAAADIRRGARLASLTGPPPGPALRNACVLSALASAVTFAPGIGSGMHARVALVWLDSASPLMGAFLMALPVCIAVSAAWQTVRLDYRRRYGLAASLPSVSPIERAARARLDGVGVLIGAAGLIGGIAVGMVNPARGRLASAAIGTAPTLLAGAALIAAQRGVSRWDKPTPAPELLDRAHALSAGRVRIRSARIDEGLEGRSRCRAILVLGSLTVSRRLVDTFTADEMDFALAQAASRAEAAALPAWANALLTLVIAGEVAGSAWMLRLLFRGDIRFLFGMLVIIAATVLVAIPAVALLQRRSDRRSALLALKATGDLEAAESALRKIAAGQEDFLSDIEGGAEGCIAYLRKASREQGLAFTRKRPLVR
ncbi:MAG TPA: hypothetical protein VGM37_05350 [Armatimonadota bacterium]|jgi:hypothetical protein